jgi:hypothetical protein
MPLAEQIDILPTTCVCYLEFMDSSPNAAPTAPTEIELSALERCSIHSTLAWKTFSSA